MHVAESTIGRLIDYCMNTPEDGFTTGASVETIKRLVEKNRRASGKCGCLRGETA
jgi:4-O-beta-D-mannosyl-D-glucose phosphorylase